MTRASSKRAYSLMHFFVYAGFAVGLVLLIFGIFLNLTDDRKDANSSDRLAYIESILGCKMRIKNISDQKSVIEFLITNTSDTSDGVTLPYITDSQAIVNGSSHKTTDRSYTLQPGESTISSLPVEHTNRITPDDITGAMVAFYTSNPNTPNSKRDYIGPAPVTKKPYFEACSF